MQLIEIPDTLAERISAWCCDDSDPRPVEPPGEASWNDIDSVNGFFAHIDRATVAEGTFADAPREFPETAAITAFMTNETLAFAVPALMRLSLSMDDFGRSVAAQVGAICTGRSQWSRRRDAEALADMLRTDRREVVADFIEHVVAKNLAHYVVDQGDVDSGILIFRHGERGHFASGESPQA